MIFEGPNSYQSKDMANVSAFADKQTDKWTGQKLYAPDLSIQGHKNLMDPEAWTCETNQFTEPFGRGKII